MRQKHKVKREADDFSNLSQGVKNGQEREKALIKQKKELREISKKIGERISASRRS